VKRLTHDLSLDSSQETQLSQILSNTQSRYDAIRQQMNPQFDQVREQSRDQIRQILTPEQRPKFEDFMRRVDEEHHRR
jgi:Spy/CpxP family protein refolding chaperone